MAHTIEFQAAKARKVLNDAEYFFYVNAGFSYPTGTNPEVGHVRCAKQLATAERYVTDNTDWGFSWEYDECGCSGCDCKSPDCACSNGTDHETLVCTVRDIDGKVLASLSGICSPTPQYSRVIEAELAEEAITSMREYAASVNQ